MAQAAMRTRYVVGAEGRATDEVHCESSRAVWTVVRGLRAATRIDSVCQEEVVAAVPWQLAATRRAPRCGGRSAKVTAYTRHISCDRLFLQRTEADPRVFRVER